jgi:hypothetical protein
VVGLVITYYPTVDGVTSRGSKTQADETNGGDTVRFNSDRGLPINYRGRVPDVSFKEVAATGFSKGHHAPPHNGVSPDAPDVLEVSDHPLSVLCLSKADEQNVGTIGRDEAAE